MAAWVSWADHLATRAPTTHGAQPSWRFKCPGAGQGPDEGGGRITPPPANLDCKHDQPASVRPHKLWVGPLFATARHGEGSTSDSTAAIGHDFQPPIVDPVIFFCAPFSKHLKRRLEQTSTRAECEASSSAAQGQAARARIRGEPEHVLQRRLGQAGALRRCRPCAAQGRGPNGLLHRNGKLRPPAPLPPLGCWPAHSRGGPASCDSAQGPARAPRPRHSSARLPPSQAPGAAATLSEQLRVRRPFPALSHPQGRSVLLRRPGLRGS